MKKLNQFSKDMLLKIGIKRLPPIVAPITIPISLTFFLIYCIFRVIIWLLGFWKCSKCGKYGWINHDRGEDDDNGDQVISTKTCTVCQVTDELSTS